MTVLKCKMCGGDLQFKEGNTVVECEYCGTKQTVPNMDDERKLALFARANRLRFACEFDKASGVYESIVADFPEEAEAYWGLVLCKYGIEYVDDPATGKKVPTCHRSSFDSVMDDDDFEQTLENADPIARAVYREEAKQMEGLRRGIIEVSGKEEPYDIFICYKETDDNGERTIDSVMAQDVYQALTEKGYRVFFSRISLEDKLGQEYEPYIFAALNSAKVMLAFGTDYERYNAVWVKNEWSRFLQLIARGEKKTLIPCYKSIDAYDMPKEFAKLQAQDMSKVGAVQDLLRGIEKLLPRNKETQVQEGRESAAAQSAERSATVASLLKRAFLFLEDGDWKNAADYCNRVLDVSPEHVEAYVGLLMAELQVKKEGELAGQKESFRQNKNFLKALRFAGEERRRILEGYDRAVEDGVTKRRQAMEKKLLEEEKRQKEKRRQEELDRALDQLSELSKLSRRGKDLDQFRKCAAFWANPDEKEENCLVDNREPKSIGDRYLYLAEHFQVTGPDGMKGMTHPESAIDNIDEWWKFSFDCYRHALKYGADKEKCSLSKTAFYERIMRLNVKKFEVIELLEKESPGDWRVYWKYYELCSNRLDKVPTYEQEVSSFLAGDYHFEQGEEEREKERELIRSLEAAIRECASFPQKQKEMLQTYVDKAFARAGDHLSALQKEWKEYLSSLDQESANEIEQLTKRLDSVQKKMDDENRWRRELDDKYKRNAMLKGTFGAILSMLLLMLAGYSVLLAWRITKEPELLLSHSVFGYTMAAVVICLMEMVLFTNIQNVLVRTEKPTYRYKKTASILIKVSRPLTVAATLAAAVLFMVGANKFNDEIGTINIGSPEEISYLKKHPGATFVITQDLDLSDAEWKAVSNFSGTLDGQGHCLKGIVTDSPYLFSANTGTIQNITFSGIEVSAGQFSLVRENRGTIKASQMRDIQLKGGEFFGFTGRNKGTLKDCTLSMLNGACTTFTGIAQEQGEKGVIENCTVSTLKVNVSQSFFGIVMDNNGTITDTVLSDCTVSGGSELAGICRDNGNTLCSCRVEALVVKDVLLSLGGGLIAKSSGSVEDCFVAGFELSGGVNGMMGGLIGQANGNVVRCSVEDCSVAGLERSGGMNGVVGGLVANSSCRVEDCSVVGFELSGELDGVLGGLIGQADGYVTRCSVEGIISLAGRSKKVAEKAPWLICGGLLGEQLGGMVKSSSATVQVNVDYKNPTHRGIFAGGLVGVIAGGGSISSSFFEGNIDIVVTEEEKVAGNQTGSKNYYGTGSFKVGGLLGDYRIGEGAASVANSYSSGRISVQVLKEVQSSSSHIYMGGFTGSSNKRLSIKDSYSDVQVVSFVPEENRSIMSNYIGNSIGGFTPDSGTGGATLVSAENCFFAGTLEYAHISTYHDCGMWGDSKVTNCYYSENCGYGKNGIPQASFHSASFLRDTLGWSGDVWNLEDGTLPTLKDTGSMVNTEPSEK